MAKIKPGQIRSYDRLADTLYLKLRREAAYRYVEDAEGLVWQLSKDGAAFGVTVQAYRMIWSDRKSDLAERIASGLHIGVGEAAANLPA